MSDKRIEALKSATAKKKQEALERTEKAIHTLIEQNHKITIRSVAREAGVSPSYIYKYPELSYRIQTLREQQKYNRIKPEAASSKSHQIIATQLRDRVKIAEREKEELIAEIKVLIADMYKMSESENSLERLKAENIKLSTENKELQKRLKYLEDRLSEQRDFILQQGSKNKDDVHLPKKTSKVIQLTSDDENLAPGILPGSITEKDLIDEEVQKLLSKTGIRLSKTMVELIKSQSKEQVVCAVNVLLKNINSGVKIKSKVGWLKSALNEDRNQRKMALHQNHYSSPKI